MKTLCFCCGAYQYVHCIYIQTLPHLDFGFRLASATAAVHHLEWRPETSH